MIEIDKRLYQGGLPKDLDKMDKNWAIVSLTNEYDPKYRETEYDKLTAHLSFPIVDGPFPGTAWLKAVVGCIESLHDSGLNVYIHCLAGISRSAMVTAAYLMKKNMWDRDAALNFIASKNSRIDPNSSFIAGLNRWESYLKRDDREWDIETY